MKIISAVICLAILALLAGVAPLSARENEQKTADQIRTRAWDIVGRDRLPEKSGLAEGLSVEMVVGRDSISPFLTEKIDGKHIWQVSSERVVLQFERWADYPFPKREYDLKVYLDSTTGQLLKITMLNDKHDTALVKKPSAESAEKQLRVPPRIQPKGDPVASLFQVLEDLPQCPTMATEIIAFYWLMDLYDRDELLPIWEIYLYGSPYFRFKPAPGESLSERSFVRYLADAVTGCWIMSSNSPNP